MKNSRPFAATALAAFAALALAACDRNDERTAGQKLDSATATAADAAASAGNAVENAAERTGEAVKSAAERTGNAVENAADRAGANIDDAKITASINTELAKDDRLSALKIDVDTDGGKVVLKGSAPDAAARDRATELASKVDGVKGVDNQLKVGG